MCSNPRSPFLAYANDETREWFWFRADCKLWGCIECSEVMKRRLAARAGTGADKLINSGLHLDHITITAHRHWRGQQRSIENFRRNWPKLRKRIQYREDVFAYAMFAEQHKKDLSMHIHMMATNSQNQRWWKNNSAACGLGHQVKVVPMDHGGLAAMYVTKYLNKSLEVLHWPRSFHRCRFSQNWPSLPDDYESTVEWRVFMSQRHFDDEMRHWYEQGYRITNTKTGEIE